MGRNECIPQLHRMREKDGFGGAEPESSLNRYMRLERKSKFAAEQRVDRF